MIKWIQSIVATAHCESRKISSRSHVHLVNINMRNFRTCKGAKGKVTCNEHPEVIFKYSIKKLLIRSIISLVCICIFALMIINEPFWHLRPYVPESLAYILNGPPRLDHYLCPEQLASFRGRNGSSRVTEETWNEIWAFYAKYGDLRPTIWHLETLRGFILISLLGMAVPIFFLALFPALFANKKIFIRLTKEHFCWYSPWFIIPITTPYSIEWSAIESVKLIRGPLFTGKEIAVRYADTTECIEKKETKFFSVKYLETSTNEMLQIIRSYVCVEEKES